MYKLNTYITTIGPGALWICACVSVNNDISKKYVRFLVIIVYPLVSFSSAIESNI